MIAPRALTIVALIPFKAVVRVALRPHPASGSTTPLLHRLTRLPGPTWVQPIKTRHIPSRHRYRWIIFPLGTLDPAGREDHAFG